jgi:histidyl-tRNA synthetase
VEDRYTLDPSITRGLDYYTGIVFETFLAADPSIGSVCSGGRYDNLTALYTKDTRINMTGVGTSVGLDRLLAAIEGLSQSNTPAASTYARIAISSTEHPEAAQKLAHHLRTNGIAAEVFLAKEKAYQKAESQGIPWFATPQQDGTVSLRNLSTRTTTENMTVAELLTMLLGT